jgi:GNAT superfamily N-acetyltransferase
MRDSAKKRSIPEHILRVAEDPSAYTPLERNEERIVDPRYVIWLGEDNQATSTVAQRLRLTTDILDDAVAEARALLAARGRLRATWRVGPSATPSDLADRLPVVGMIPADESYVVGMVLIDPPAGPPSDMPVRRVHTLEEYKTALEITIEALGMDLTTASEMRARQGGQFAAEQAAARRVDFLAVLDGEPVASAKAAFTDAGLVLEGGSTLPRARGRGAYRALVAARWQEAVRRGTPALIVQVGEKTRPLLERLGFHAVCEIRIFLDETRH